MTDAASNQVEVTNANGCVWNFRTNVTVLASTNIPMLTLITTDASGHNVISWSNAEAFQTINVYKEGTSLNDFQLIGSTNATDGSFIDANSDATQKAERYRLTGVTADGSESPESTIHKTVHLTINRGVEISSVQADGERSLLREQVHCGVLARMALLDICLGGDRR